MAKNKSNNNSKNNASNSSKNNASSSNRSQTSNSMKDSHAQVPDKGSSRSGPGGE
jgi:hypothetical protein